MGETGAVSEISFEEDHWGPLPHSHRVTIQEVESCINSQPLTFVSDERDDDEPLTPAHFLLGHGLGYIHSHSTIDPLESPSDLGHRYELRKSLLDKFWSVWTADYIRNLPPWRGF